MWPMRDMIWSGCHFRFGRIREQTQHYSEDRKVVKEAD
ncbi:hypothetical protein F441_13185 [Phytophthora nicotianae CJ01A1]|uniref:Uncharacterized protein n=2 Tax=Phytophthora nicotianae TaxID=4792 RepID=W2YWA0_PHYNI|nr:hypothetical protein F441_13185 [Phytophthora nicotianae CJ01A1]ETP39422.1 hypothetical protein F442_13112 [Phytophthora nicotianae P10297]